MAIFRPSIPLCFENKSSMVEWGDVAAGEEAVDVGLSVPVFVAVAGVAEEAVVAEAFQVAVFDSKECHQGFVVVKTWRGE